MSVARQTIIALLGLTSGLGAGAQEATPDTWMLVPPTKSRLQVREELQQARQDGSISFTAATYTFAPRSAATKLRAHVLAELWLARLSGECHEINSEAYTFRTTPATTYAVGSTLASR